MAVRTVSVVLQAKISDYQAKMSAASRATSDLAANVDKATGRTKEGFATLGRVGVAAGAAVAAGLGLAVKTMADFDSQMAQVKTLSHATAAEMTSLRQAALSLGQGIGFSAQQSAEAETELVKAGVSVKDIMGGALKGSLDLAAAGQVNVADATETAAIAMTQFRLAGKDVPHIADLLAAGADKALGGVGDLSYALKQGGLVASQFGLSIEDTIGTLAAFAQAGLMGEQAGSTLRQMLLKLAAPSAQASKTMSDLGISLYDASGKFVGITNLAGQLHDKLSTLPEAQRNAAMAVIFGARSIQGANVLYQDGAKGIANWIKSVDDSGFAAHQASGKMDSLSGDLSKLKAAFENDLIKTGSSANGALRGMAQGVTDLLRVYGSLPPEVQMAVTALVGVTGVVAATGGAFLIAVPKIAAYKAAMAEMPVTAQKAARGLGQVAAAASLVGTAVVGASFLSGEFRKWIGDTVKDGPKAAAVLEGIAYSGQVTKDAMGKLGANAYTLGDALHATFNTSTAEDIGRVFSKIGSLGGVLPWGDDATDAANRFFKSLDAGLTTLATNGKAGEAAQVFKMVAAQAQRQGISIDQLNSKLPLYAQALAVGLGQTQTMTQAAQQFSAAMQDSADSTKSATQAAKDLNDTLHAMADPVFAMQKAISDLADAQAAAADAIKKHGAASQEAKQANIDVAQSALGVTDAATTLAGAVKDGTTSVEQFHGQLKQWVAQGLITQQQAVDVSRSLDPLISKSRTLAQTDITITPKAEVQTPIARLQELLGISQRVAQQTPTITPTADTRTAKERLQDVLGITDQLARATPVVKVGVDGAAAVRQSLGDIYGQMLTINRTPVRVATGLTGSPASVLGNILGGEAPRSITGGSGQRRATGGRISGPGSTTSDSVLIRASRDEFVVNAAAYAKHRPLVEAINADRFVDGGAVNRAASGPSVLSRLNATINVGMTAPSSQAISAAIKAATYLTELWQQGNQLAEQARQRGELVASLNKANADLGAAQAKHSAADIASAVTAVKDATKQLADFDRQSAQDAEQRKTDAAQAAMQAREQLAANREQWAFDHLSAQQQIADLTKRMAAEQQYSDQWMSDAHQREQLQQQIADAAKQSASDVLSTLNGLLDSQATLTKQLTQAQADYAAGMADAQRQLITGTQQALAARLKELTSWTSLTTSHAALVGWSSTDQAGADDVLRNLGMLSAAIDAYDSQNAMSADQLTANIDQQVAAMREWSDDLAQLRARGMSDQVISALGLDKSPEALAQVRALVNGTDSQLSALNDKVLAYTQAAGVEVSREQTGLYGDLGQQLLDLQQQFNSRVADLQGTLISTTQDVQTQLAALGQASGRSYADALAAGINSGIPGIIAAAQAAQAAASAAAMVNPDTIRNLTSNGAAHGTAIGVPVAKASVVINYAPSIDARYGTEGTAAMIDNAQRRFLQEFASVAGAGIST